MESPRAALRREIAQERPALVTSIFEGRVLLGWTRPGQRTGVGTVGPRQRFRCSVGEAAADEVRATGRGAPLLPDVGGGLVAEHDLADHLPPIGLGLELGDGGQRTDRVAHAEGSPTLEVV